MNQPRHKNVVKSYRFQRELLWRRPMRYTVCADHANRGLLPHFHVAVGGAGVEEALARDKA